MYANVCPCCGGKTLSKEKENYVCLYCGTQFGFVETEPEINYADLYVKARYELREKLAEKDELITSLENMYFNELAARERKDKQYAEEQNKTDRLSNWLAVTSMLTLISFLTVLYFLFFV